MDRNLGVTEGIRNTSPEWLDPVYYLMSLPGDWMLLVPLLALLYLGDVLGTLRDTERSSQLDEPLCTNRTVFIIATIFGGFALIYLIKSVIGAPRPPEELHVVTVSTASVPSGHVMAATIFWGAIALWSERGGKRERILLAVILIGLVAISRLGLGVHFLFDVVVAVMFGSGYLAIVAVSIEENPMYALVVAALIAMVAVVVTGGQGRAILALGGILGAYVGWRFVESPPVRNLLIETISPPLQRGS